MSYILPERKVLTTKKKVKVKKNFIILHSLFLILHSIENKPYTLNDDHKAQLINYLKATDKEIGFLFNFGKKPEFKRIIFSNINKIL